MSDPDPPRLSWRDQLVLLPAEGFGTGRIPVAPGTFGSLWCFPLGWALNHWSAGATECLLIWAVMMLAGVPLCRRAAELRGRKDPGSVVWDEMTAFPLVYCFSERTAGALLAGFLLFRLFDIAKPWPIRRFERLPDGWGVMADDQIAGVFAGALLLLVEQLPGL